VLGCAGGTHRRQARAQAFVRRPLVASEQTFDLGFVDGRDRAGRNHAQPGAASAGGTHALACPLDRCIPLVAFRGA
jgi:hypothetical protein